MHSRQIITALRIIAVSSSNQMPKPIKVMPIINTIALIKLRILTLFVIIITEVFHIAFCRFNDSIILNKVPKG